MQSDGVSVDAAARQSDRRTRRLHSNNVYTTGETRRHSLEVTPPPRHIEVGNTSLSACCRYTGLNFSALCRNCFPHLRFHMSYQSTTGPGVNTTKM